MTKQFLQVYTENQMYLMKAMNPNILFIEVSGLNVEGNDNLLLTCPRPAPEPQPEPQPEVVPPPETLENDVQSIE